MGRKIIVDLENEKVDLGRQEQVSFETKEELLRLAHGILLKIAPSPASTLSEKVKPANVKKEVTLSSQSKSDIICEMCSKPIEGKPHIEIIGEKAHNFDCKECAQTFKKLRSVFGENFQ